MTPRKGELVFPTQESRGLELRNNLRRFLNHRRRNGVPVGSRSGWARAAAYVSRYLDGDDMSTATVRKRALEIGLVIETGGGDTDGALIYGAALEVGAAGLHTVSAQQVGSDIGATKGEKAAIGHRQTRCIDAEGESAAVRGKRLARERQARLRAAKADIGQVDYTPRSKSLSATRPWEAEGICRRTWEKRHSAQKRDGAQPPIDRGCRDEFAQPPGERDEFAQPPTDQTLPSRTKNEATA